MSGESLHVRCSNGHTCIVPVIYTPALTEGVDAMCAMCGESVRGIYLETLRVIMAHEDRIVRLKRIEEGGKVAERTNTQFFSSTDAAWLKGMRISGE